MRKLIQVRPAEREILAGESFSVAKTKWEKAGEKIN